MAYFLIHFIVLCHINVGSDLVRSDKANIFIYYYVLDQYHLLNSSLCLISILL